MCWHHKGIKYYKFHQTIGDFGNSIHLWRINFANNYIKPIIYLIRWDKANIFFIFLDNLRTKWSVRDYDVLPYSRPEVGECPPLKPWMTFSTPCVHNYTGHVRSLFKVTYTGASWSSYQVHLTFFTINKEIVICDDSLVLGHSGWPGVFFPSWAFNQTICGPSMISMLSKRKLSLWELWGTWYDRGLY